MRTWGFLLIILLFSRTSLSAKSFEFQIANTDNSINTTIPDSLAWADYYFNIHRYKKALPLYQKNLGNTEEERKHILKKMALSEAALENPSKSIEYIYECFKTDFNPNFLLSEGFDPIRKTEVFQSITTKLIPRATPWSLVFLFVALIGFYVVFIIVLNNKIHPTSRGLIGLFVFIHSLFILNISVNRANYLFEYPHAYLMSTWASFLYGPLLYFYFKTTTQKYRFKKRDVLHLIPTVILLAFLVVEVYSMSGEAKIRLMLARVFNGLNPSDSDKLLLLVLLKIASLAIYGYLVWKVYLKSRMLKLLSHKNQIWQKNIYHIHIFYVITYSIYGIVIINQFDSGILFDTSAIAMAAMVLYVGYSANIQPDVFNGAYSYINRLFPKYQKSGLTPSLSLELKENLLDLFANEKIYKENNISLDMVALRLNTTRHNASQIINEHFNVSFHEFVNIYRIKEAKQLLLDKKARSLNIINIAYEVGYNNKVTFNKAFKKDTQLTPSQYQKSVLKS
ncbi:helix-turn-helix domain-containing protein [Muricauda sp. JGD-17]|uniref:Helix-turn-helix domain-containing protein n=1 Tax=Flagellimonas ochracea TaxID=2696472 RepID=A0A964WW75_9FLAO|nr:AraC family transcriptional regulator [Allomuricauda ochracea]NAY90309.1 helix-turn-helix domain-containing protein [Allomuricauda ochracea]